MAIELDKLPTQSREVWNRLPPRRRLLLGTVAALTLAGAAYAGLRGPTESYSVLFSGLQPEDAGHVVAELHTLNVPYHVLEGGTAIEVPSARVHETRITLASSGLPRGGGVGFEVFDKQPFGATSFVEQINYRRALQGELARTVSSLDAVEHARVHIAIPEKTVFAKDDDPPSASVVVQLRPGRTLSPSQIKGVVNLVASSVEGLRSDRVTLVDESGAVLWAGNDSQGLGDQHELERTLARRVTEIVERVVGPGHAAVAVTAELDPAELERTEDSYDKDKAALRSETHTEDKGTDGTDGSGGVSGAQGNLPGTGAADPQAAAGEGGSHSHTAETKNFEISHVVSHSVARRNRVKRLHVAVLVDAKDGAGRPAPELDRIKSLAREAAGIEDERGDRIEVHSAPFAKLPEPEAAKPPPWSSTIDSKWVSVAAALAVLLMVGLAALLWGRSGRKGAAAANVSRSLPMAVRDVEAMVDGRPLAELPGASARTRAIDAAKSDSARAARVLSSWLDDEKRPENSKT